MKELLLLLFGMLVGRYIIEWLDIFTDFLHNLQTLKASKIQKEINDMVGEQEEINTNAVGFRFEPEPEEESEYIEEE
jgi:hypothetical protein